VLAIVLYVVAALAVVVIGLVAVGRETFIAAHTVRPAIFDMEEAVEFVSDTLDDRAASRLTPDDVKWILRTDADRLEEAAGKADVLEDGAACAAVMERLTGPRRRFVDAQDVAAVLAGRTRYLEAIGAIGPQAPSASTDVTDAD
jgi:hypothetical protein